MNINPFFFTFSRFFGLVIYMKQAIESSEKQVRGLALGLMALVFIGLIIVFSFVSTYAAIFLASIVCAFFIFLIYPRFGLYLTILALPVINWNFYIRGLVIPLVDVLAGINFFAFSARSLYLKLFTKTEPLQFPQFALFLAFTLSAIISAFFAPSFATSFWYTIRWIVFLYAAFIFVPVNVIKSKQTLRNSLICFFVSATLVAFMGIISLFFQDWQNTFVRIVPVQVFGIFPIGDNQNLIAEFLVIAVFFAFALREWIKSSLGRKLITVMGILFALVAIGTFSRAAWITLLFQGSLYVVAQSKAFRQRFIIPLLLGLVIMIPLGFYMFEIQSAFSIGVSSTENRWLMTQIAGRAWLDSPLFGKGSGEFINLVADDIRFRAQYGDPLDSHGLWQKILAENGLAGILTFAMFLSALSVSVWRSMRRLSQSAKNMALPIILGAAGGLLFQFFNTSYYKGKVWVPIALALAAVAILENKNGIFKKN